MNETKATRYRRWRRRAEVAGSASAVLMLGLVAFTPAAGWLASQAEAFTFGWASPLRPIVTLVLFVLLLVLLWEAAALPATIYVALRIDPAYSRQALRVEDVLGAQAIATAVALPVALAAALVVQVAVLVAGPVWWAAAGVLLGLALAGALGAAPSLLARLGEVHPFTRKSLARRLDDLARQAGVPLAGIHEWRIAEPAPTSAIVTGVARGRRVLVSGELVRDWSDDEVAVVVAHELAHHAHRDLWRAWALNAVLMAAGLFLADRVLRLMSGAVGAGGPGTLATLPLTAFVAAVVWIAATPARHAQSRRHERRADAFALAVTGNAEAFGAAVRRLGARHLAEERPSALTRWLYFSHPPVAERLAFAEAYRRRQAEQAPAIGSAARR
jgi:STE24 endopeptidase